MRPLVAHISLSALAHNLAQVRRFAPGAKVMSVVKANAYGHDLIHAAQGLKDSDGFAVLNLSEAIALREAGILHPLLLLEGVFSPEQLEAVDHYALDIVIHHEAQLDWLANATLQRPIRVFLKLDSGMHRLGFRPQAFLQARQRLAKLPQVSEIVQMTHFANADRVDGISSAMSVVADTMDTEFSLSLANSAAIVQHASTHAGWVRPGIMLYGASPIASQSAASFHLQPVMQLQSALIAVQTLSAGDSVGYGSLFTATQTMRIGIVACGYADGYPRHAPTGTPIAVNGVMTRTLGRVSMDMLAVDLVNVPDAQIGAAVELWGAQVPVDEVAIACSTIGYELLCAVAPRVPKQFHG